MKRQSKAKESPLCKLVRDAIPFIRKARQELFDNVQVNGVVYHEEAKKDLAKFDSWLRKALPMEVAAKGQTQ